jgi:hypothetical protein
LKLKFIFEIITGKAVSAPLPVTFLLSPANYLFHFKRFRATLTDEESTKTDKIEKKFKEFCKDVKSKENRFCYYLGGTEDAATGKYHFIHS